MILKRFNDAIFILQNSPWKFFNEIKMIAIKLPVYIVIRYIKGVDIKFNYKIYGYPKIFRYRKSEIRIGDNFENRNNWDSNPLGINHPTILCTWSSKAKIIIGNDVGISGGSIVAATKIVIGDGTLIGANNTIIDTDFHPLDSPKRRYATHGIRSKPIKIGKNVFIGMECIILKGVEIPDNSVIPAGSVIRKWEK